MHPLILKFGGTSVGTLEAIGQSAAIAVKAARSNRVVVVVSALGGVTDQLLQLIALAKRHKPRLITNGLKELEERHRATLRSFTPSESFDSVWHDEFAGLFQ